MQKDNTTIENEVIEIIVNELGVDKDDVTREKSFVEDFNADSLDLTQFVMTLEEHFGCEISNEESEKLKTVGDAINYIQTRTNVA